MKNASTRDTRTIGSVEAMQIRSVDKFFSIADMFKLSAKEWAEILDSLDELPTRERRAVLDGRDDEYGWYR